MLCTYQSLRRSVGLVLRAGSGVKTAAITDADATESSAPWQSSKLELEAHGPAQRHTPLPRRPIQHLMGELHDRHSMRSVHERVPQRQVHAGPVQQSDHRGHHSVQRVPRLPPRDVPEPAVRWPAGIRFGLRSVQRRGLPEQAVAGGVLGPGKRGLPRVCRMPDRVLQPGVRVELKRYLQAVHGVRGRHVAMGRVLEADQHGVCGGDVQFDDRVRLSLLLLQRDRHAELHAALDAELHAALDRCAGYEKRILS
jgi:hypothetical protein